MIIEYETQTDEIKWRYSGDEEPTDVPNADSGTEVVTSGVTTVEIQSALGSADPADGERAYLTYDADTDSVSVAYETVETAQ